MANFEIKIEGLDKLQKNFAKSPTLVVNQLKWAIKTSVNLIRPMMVAEAPAKTSKLRQNIQASHSGLTGKVGPNLSVTPYAIFVNSGTRPHIIRPRTAKALYWPGAKHPVKMVHHPGTKANPFVERTAMKAEGPVNQIFSKSIDKVISNLVK